MGNGGTTQSSVWLDYIRGLPKRRRGQSLNHAIFDALAVSGRIPRPAINKMRLVQDHGWPEARTSMKDDNGHRLIVKKNQIIWLLKCKPSCWRLYFYVYENHK